MESKRGVQLVTYSVEKLDSLVEFQNRVAHARRRLSRASLETALTDHARAFGENVVVTLEDDQLSGFAGWVKGDSGEFFSAPFVAATQASAEAIVSRLLLEAKSQNWARVTAAKDETFKRNALEEAGFTRLFDFVDYEFDPKDLVATLSSITYPIDSQFRTEPLRSVTSTEFANLMNASFEGADNTLPTTEQQASDFLKSDLLHQDLSWVIRSSSGQALAYCYMQKDGYIESIGVLPSAQKLNLGSSLTRELILTAAELGLPRVYTTVSSRNEASLRLHARLGMPEIERRTVYQLNRLDGQKD